MVTKDSYREIFYLQDDIFYYSEHTIKWQGSVFYFYLSLICLCNLIVNANRIRRVFIFIHLMQKFVIKNT